MNYEDYTKCFLNMPLLSAKEVEGLFKTFILYCRLDDSYYELIRKAEVDNEVFQELKSTDTMKKVVLGIIILLISFIALILIIEGTYYIYMLFLGKTQHNSNVIDFSISDLFAPDEKAGYILKPNASTTHLPDWEHQREIYDKHSPGAGKRISTNSAGYRGKLYDVSKDENTTRLLVLGGSTTWGPYNDDGSTWPDYLEEMLQEEIYA